MCQRDKTGERLQNGKRTNRGRVEPYNHILPKAGKQVVYSKRYVDTNVHKANSSKVASPSKEPSGNKSARNKRKASEAKEESVKREKGKEKQRS